MALTKIVADRVAIHWAYVGGEGLPSEAIKQKQNTRVPHMLLNDNEQFKSGDAIPYSTSYILVISPLKYFSNL